LYEIYINCMLCYHFSRNISSDIPIHTSLCTGSCLVAVQSLHCLPKYYTHLTYIQFIPPSVCHIRHQVLPNYFSSHSSLTFTGMKFWVRHPYKHAFLTKFKWIRILAAKFSPTYKKSTI
jgi:hypothetical protein